MRYAVVSKGLTISQLQDEVKRCGGRNIRVASVSKQIFCDLDSAGEARLQTVPGLAVKRVERKITTPEAQQKVCSPPVTPPAYPDVPIYAASLVNTASGFYEFRELVSPPATGSLFTICILDSGIRKTHQGLENKVIHEVNFSSSPTVEDIYDHGTGVAFCAAGGRHSAGEECGGAPGAYLWNIKVLDDDGYGSDENCVLGIEHCCEKIEEARALGLPPSEPMYPNLLNLSWGAPDDGDPDNSIRVACRAAREKGLDICAAAGNYGPGSGTVTLPATDPEVWGIGAVTFYPFEVWQYSSRGPTKEGVVKPDLVFYGVRVLTASSKADNAFVIKSGTSFASPFLKGFAACGLEMLQRLYGARARTEEEMLQYGMRVQEELFPTGRLTVKPPGAPAEKDNDYGYGMPFAELWSKQLMPTMDIESMIGNLAPILAIGMMGTMMTSITKAFK